MGGQRAPDLHKLLPRTLLQAQDLEAAFGSAGFHGCSGGRRRVLDTPEATHGDLLGAMDKHLNRTDRAPKRRSASMKDLAFPWRSVGFMKMGIQAQVAQGWL